MPDPSPMLPAHPAAWPGVLVIVILAVFLTAAVLGPMIRANLEDEEDAAERGKSE